MCGGDGDVNWGLGIEAEGGITRCIMGCKKDDI